MNGKWEYRLYRAAELGFSVASAIVMVRIIAGPDVFVKLKGGVYQAIASNAHDKSVYYSQLSDNLEKYKSIVNKGLV